MPAEEAPDLVEGRAPRDANLADSHVAPDGGEFPHLHLLNRHLGDHEPT